MAQVNLSTKQKQIHRCREQTWVAKGEWGGSGMDREFGVSRYQLLHLEWINKILLYSTGDYTQFPGIDYDGKEYKKECTYTYD